MSLVEIYNIVRVDNNKRFCIRNDGYEILCVFNDVKILKILKKGKIYIQTMKHFYKVGRIYNGSAIPVNGRLHEKVQFKWTGKEFVFAGDDEYLGEVEMVLKFDNYPLLPKWERKA